jgi:hypothetical protein
MAIAKRSTSPAVHARIKSRPDPGREETMHYTGSFHTISRTSTQVLILAAVAAAGIAVGRWAVPADHSSAVVAVTRVATPPSELSRARAEQKLVQMDQLGDQRAALAAVAPSSRTSLSAAERKLIQMDQADDRRAALAAAAAPSSNTSLSSAERKLIQMDQADDQRAASAGAAGSSGSSLSAAERKLIQMDARDGR